MIVFSQICHPRAWSCLYDGVALAADHHPGGLEAVVPQPQLPDDAAVVAVISVHWEVLPIQIRLETAGTCNNQRCRRNFVKVFTICGEGPHFLLLLIESTYQHIHNQESIKTLCYTVVFGAFDKMQNIDCKNFREISLTPK